MNRQALTRPRDRGNLRAASAPLHPPDALMADRRTVRVHARVSSAKLADWPGRPALPVRGRGLA